LSILSERGRDQQREQEKQGAKTRHKIDNSTPPGRRNKPPPEELGARDA
jgi:hypothetical protein